MMQVDLEFSFSEKTKHIFIEVACDNRHINTFSLGETSNITFFVENSKDTINHKIYIKLFGKSENDTIVDEFGKIISDKFAILTRISFDSIDVTELYTNGHQCYKHSHNNTTKTLEDEFYGFMGCNGIVTIDFYTPIHKWFLENSE